MAKIGKYLGQFEKFVQQNKISILLVGVVVLLIILYVKWQRNTIEGGEWTGTRENNEDNLDCGEDYQFFKKKEDTLGMYGCICEKNWYGDNCEKTFCKKGGDGEPYCKGKNKYCVVINDNVDIENHNADNVDCHCHTGYQLEGKSHDVNNKGNCTLPDKCARGEEGYNECGDNCFVIEGASAGGDADGVVKGYKCIELSKYQVYLLEYIKSHPASQY